MGRPHALEDVDGSGVGEKWGNKKRGGKGNGNWYVKKKILLKKEFKKLYLSIQFPLIKYIHIQ